MEWAGRKKVKAMTNNMREKLEADIRQWLDSRLIGNEVYETVISWIDRQAEITAQVYGDWIGTTNELQAKVDDLTVERDHLLEQIQKYADEAANFEQTLADFEQTHIKLPVDADGAPIRLGDTLVIEFGGSADIGDVSDIHLREGKCVVSICFEHDGGITALPEYFRHVKPDTVESLLEEFHGKLWSDDEEQMALLEEYAERIRRACQ